MSGLGRSRLQSRSQTFIQTQRDAETERMPNSTARGEIYVDTEASQTERKGRTVSADG